MKALGYAEADPTADVEGHDVQVFAIAWSWISAFIMIFCNILKAKISILAKLAFGRTVPDPSLSVPCAGISKITAVRFDRFTLILMMATDPMDHDRLISNTPRFFAVQSSY
jgi:homoserine dehydrogenase